MNENFKEINIKNFKSTQEINARRRYRNNRGEEVTFDPIEKTTVINHTKKMDIYRKVRSMKNIMAESHETIKFVDDCDSLTCAERIVREHDVRPLVLNFANPISRGGGVAHGYRAQEECLCIQSNLYNSLVSHDADEYYEFNKGKGYTSSDMAILSEGVTVFKNLNNKNNLLDEPFKVDVLTIAAPHIKGMHGVGERFYYDILAQRIDTIVVISEYYQYSHVIYGAFGCGAFHNDPKVVAEDFRDSLDARWIHIRNVYFPILINNEIGVQNYLTFEDILS